MSINSNTNNLELDTKRHSFAHLMAAAVEIYFRQEAFIEAKENNLDTSSIKSTIQFGVGPVIENGCYYDFILPRNLVPEDLKKIEKIIRDLIKKDLRFERKELELAQAIEYFTEQNQPLKVELLESLRDKGTTSLSEEERSDLGSNSTTDYKDYLFSLKSKILFETPWEETPFRPIEQLIHYLNYYSAMAITSGFELPFNNAFETFHNNILELAKVTSVELGNTVTKADLIKILEFIKKPELQLSRTNELTVIGVKALFGIDTEKFEYGGIDQPQGVNEIPTNLLIKANNEQDYLEVIFNLIEARNLPAITTYSIIDNKTEETIFTDLCKGPHIELIDELKNCGFKLDKFSASYWRGDQERGVNMQRLYALVYDTPEELEKFINDREEAKRRDHRLLNTQHKWFSISELVGAGLAMMQPKGQTIRKLIQNYLWQLHKNHKYQEVWTPHMAKEVLYQTSGHAKHYLDDMFSVYGGTSKENFYLKPMNCPHHMQLFADNQFSYRDMPIRYFEHATVYRDEKTGQLSGLTRVRNITQDDGHLFARLNQLTDEVDTIVGIIKEFMATFGMAPKWVSLSVRDKTDNWLGSDDMWKIAEESLRLAAVKHEIPYKIVEGEAAFYGPKLDFMFEDCLGRQQQLSTIQIDFNLPERFDLSFTNETGEKERPVVVHRAIAGSAERFMGVMIEHYTGKFPFWLAPEQIRILTINDQVLDHVKKITDVLDNAILMQPLKYNEIRYSVDSRSESLGKKIKESKNDKIPMLMVVGGQDVESNQVSIEYNGESVKVGLGELKEWVEGVK